MDFHNDEDAKEQLSELTGQILADKHPVEWTVNPNLRCKSVANSDKNHDFGPNAAR